MIRQIFYGYKYSTSQISNKSLLLDASPREIFIITSLLLPVLGIGLYPDLTLPLWSEKVKSVVNPINEYKTSYQSLYFKN